MIKNQSTMKLSPYMALYDVVVPKDNILRKIILQAIYDLSDVDIVERSKYDMSFKYFLDMAPEDSVIEPSSLTKFRKLRLQDVGLLNLLIGKTVGIAIEKGIIKSKSIIVDSTHTKARYNQKTPREVLLNYSKNLRKAVYRIDENLKSIMPAKVNNGILEDEIEYCRKLKLKILLAMPPIQKKKSGVCRGRRNKSHRQAK